MRRTQYRYTEEARARVDLLKRDLCYQIQRVAMHNQWSQRAVAERLGTSPSCLSEVYNYRLDRLSLSQLFRYLAIMHPRFEVLIAI